MLLIDKAFQESSWKLQNITVYRIPSGHRMVYKGGNRTDPSLERLSYITL